MRASAAPRRREGVSRMWNLDGSERKVGMSHLGRAWRLHATLGRLTKREGWRETWSVQITSNKACVPGAARALQLSQVNFVTNLLQYFLTAGRDLEQSGHRQ
jgi:hypothetical protein